MIAYALAGWDWVFVVWSLLVVVGVGLYYSRRAGKDLNEYFLSGRNLPWWALGTSMVATTFAADTPLAVTELVVKDGTAGNWVWWNFMLGGTLTVFVFSRLWRRSRVVTEIELVARRYDGAPAKLLRGFKAVYLGLILNSIVIGWVTKGMVSVMRVVFPEANEVAILGVLIGLTFVYTAISGLWGVVATDVLQFAMAMIGSILLAALAVAEVGGLGALVTRIETIEAETGRSFLSMFPAEPWSAVFLVLVLVNWWAVYYPGAEPGGGGYVAQRMLAAKDERHARGGTLWFIFAHYVVRPWPWVLVALSAVVLDARFRVAGIDGPTAQSAYPAMFRLLPVGLHGLVIASFIAAYMSTITSQLNLAASYLVNDLYLPFFAKGRPSARAQVVIARGAVALATVTGSAVALAMASVKEGWQTIMDLTAGIGLVLILRWLWWRVNAWSEITAMVASAVGYLVFHGRLGDRTRDPNVEKYELLATVGLTTVAWLVATYLTRPVNAAHLERFYRDVRPGGAWRPLARATGIAPASLPRDAGMWFASTAFVFGALIASGSALFLRWAQAGWFCALSVAGLVTLLALLRTESRDPAPAAADTPSA